MDEMSAKNYERVYAFLTSAMGPSRSQLGGVWRMGHLTVTDTGVHLHVDIRRPGRAARSKVVALGCCVQDPVEELKQILSDEAGYE